MATPLGPVAESPQADAVIASAAAIVNAEHIERMVPPALSIGATAVPPRRELEEVPCS